MFVLNSLEGGSSPRDHEQTEVYDDTEGERKCEQVQEDQEIKEPHGDPEEKDHMDEETQHSEEGYCAHYPECTSLDLRETDDENSPPESPRPLTEETRNLTASELLLNK